MGIQPIDLQTLYAQMEKVGKQRNSEQQALANTADKQKESVRSDADKKVHSVQQMEESSSGIAVNKDSHDSSFMQNNDKKKQQQEEESQTTENQPKYITDPELGRKIDFSG